MTPREALIDQLKGNVLTVTFTKKDGTERVMRCTLREDLLPKREVNENTERKVNEEVLPVYDLEANGFRSFRVDSIKDIRIES